MSHLFLRLGAAFKASIIYNSNGVAAFNNQYDELNVIFEKMDRLRNTRQGDTWATFTTLFPEYTEGQGNLDSIGMCYVMHIKQDADPAAVLATYRFVNTLSIINHHEETSTGIISPSDMTVLEFVDRIDSELERLGAWSFLDRGFIAYLKTNLISTLEMDESQQSDINTAADAMSFLSAVCLRHVELVKPSPYKGVRSSAKAATSWMQSILMQALQHMEWGRINRYSNRAFTLCDIAATAIKEFWAIRKCRLDATHTTPHLSGADPVHLGHQRFGQRVMGIGANTFDFVHGGPAVRFGEYTVNVAMAYKIMAQVYNDMDQHRRNGNHQSNMRWNLYRNPATNQSFLPIISGTGNEKHMKAIELIKLCCGLIIQHPPILAQSASGPSGSVYTVDYGTTHADISNNMVINSSLCLCSRCAVILGPDARHYSNGSIYLDHPISISDNTVWCEMCVQNNTAYMVDTNSWITNGDYTSIHLYTYGAINNERLSSTRELRITSETNRLINTVKHRCRNCDHYTYKPDDLATLTSSDPAIQEFLTALTGRIMPESPIGLRICECMGRRPSQDIGTYYKINGALEIWDTGTPQQLCTRCTRAASLYLDPSTNKYYSHVDASPTAPAYGYNVHDESGRYLDRVIGIEFETGPGSARVQDKDAFLNERCSDSIHIWNIHSDGSLMSGSCEVTTPPVGGLAIPMAVDAMFQLAKRDKFSIENISAGMHIHTDVTDLWSVLLPVREAWMRDPSCHLYPQFCNQLGKFGDAASELSRKFVSVRRRGNSYCSGGFGVRSWSIGGSDPMATYSSTINTGGRQAFCVHQHNGYSKRKKVTFTLENRLWPSSNSAEFTLARCELSQKMVDVFAQLAIPALQGGDLSDIVSLVDNFYLMLDLPVHELVDATCEMFNISDEGREILFKIHRRYFWVSYYAHEHGLAVNGPEMRAIVNEQLTRNGLRPGDVINAVRDELAGVLIGKTEVNPGHTPLGDPNNIVMMDTIISSHACNPIASDTSDLVVVPTTTFVSVNH